MTIFEYEVNCFERTLMIKVPDEYGINKDSMFRVLDNAYDMWHSAEDIENEEQRRYVEDSCLEEFMMECFSKFYPDWTEWCVVEWEAVTFNQ